MKLKNSEKVSGKTYSNYLCEKGINSTWHKGDDPPDLVFEFDGNKQAIEVTELHQYLENSEGEIELLTAWSHIDDICSKAKAELGEDLHKKVTLCITIPLSVQERKKLFPEITSYIRQNQSGTKKLFQRDNCWISSENGDPDVIGIISTSAGAKTPGTHTTIANVKTNLEYSLNRILESKLPRLKQLTYFNQRILLIFSQHMFGTVDRLQDAIRGFKPIPKYIDEIYLVKDNKIFPLSIR